MAFLCLFAITIVAFIITMILRTLLLGFLVLFLGGFPPLVHAQQDGLLQLNDPLHGFLLRQQTLNRLPDAFLNHQPLSAYEARRYLDTLATQQDQLSRTDQTLLARFRGEAHGPGISTFQGVVPSLYKNGQDFLSFAAEDYALQINPLFYLSYGQAQQTEQEGRDEQISVWQNTRGVRASGHIGPAIFFESRLEENQRRDVRTAFALDTAPRLGYTKFDKKELFYDYWIATGMIGYRSRHFEVRFGRDRNRWGYGKGSLMLSNYATVYDQLQIRTTFWKLQYTNLFTRLADQTPREQFNLIVPRKFAAFHQLALHLTKRLQISLFESVIFSSPDTLGVREKGFELAYLNPIIFYRSVESDLVNPDGNPDNVLLGGGISWVVIPGLNVYSEVMIDELRVSEIGKEWWGNKWGWMAGVHLADLPVSNLSARLEYARLRPYLYSHQTTLSAYVHYNDLIGHPAGPNAIDVSLFLDYQPVPRLQTSLNISRTLRGRDTANKNYGSDPLASYFNRASERGVRILQGVRQTNLLVEGHVGYELLPNTFLELALRAESTDDAEAGVDRYVAPFILLRWGLPFQSTRY